MRDPKFNAKVYDCASIAVVTASTNYDLKANSSGTLFANVSNANYVRIVTDQTISIRFNSTSMPAITMTSTQSPLVFDQLNVGNIYITNASGSTANLRVELYS